MATLNRFRIGFILFLCGIVNFHVHAQQSLKADNIALPVIHTGAPLSVVEKELMPVCEEVLRGKAFDKKLEVNELLLKSLLATLKRPESYDYKFDSLTTISRIYPQDQSFRLFTWLLRDPSGNTTYHGVVQRKIMKADKTFEIVVVPLEDRVDMIRDIENIRLSNDQWMGAIYYKPRNTDFGVLTYEGTSIRQNSMTGKEQNEKTKYYVVLGMNEHNAESNYKMIDVITFDPKYPNKVFFGAPIFYFRPIPQSRVVFKYSENATFSLNYMPVIDGKKKVNMIVFEHIAEPKFQNPTSLYQYGSDGSVDALKYYDKTYEMRKGFLGVKRNVSVYEKGTAEFDDKVREKERLREVARSKINPKELDQMPSSRPKK